jgi:two-component system response regulator RegA
MKLLIVEDDIPFAQTLARRLRKHNFECVVCHQAAAVLQHCQSHQPDYILLDMNLDGDSGLQLLTPIKQCLPCVKVVLLTGYASIATAVEAMRLGADDYLAKPVTTQMLLKSLGGSCELGDDDLDIEQTMSPDRVEWEHIQQMLASNDGNVSATARQLSMHRRTLQRKLQKKPVAK